MAMMLSNQPPASFAFAVAPYHDDWDYNVAFSRNFGLISPQEQQVLRNSRVAIPGLGGVGGIHALTFARLGIGNFTIADPDHFETANFNRQVGATLENLGRSKAEVIANQLKSVNPEADVRAHFGPVTPENISEFLEGVDLVVDSIDFFAIEVRRLVFREARRRGIWALTAGPIGFSAAWLLFDPAGMSFDTYFDLDDSMPRLDQLIAFAVGLAPRATHLAYLDLEKVDVSSGTGPSSSLACQLCSGVAAAEAVKILLCRGKVHAAPWYFQFDAYRQTLRKGRLRLGNRNPVQRLKRAWLRRRIRQAEGRS